MSLQRTGLALSLIGAILDFTSGTLIFGASSMPLERSMGMTAITMDANVWTTILYGLGGLLVITGIAGATRIGTGRMHLTGGIMTAYGVIMLIIGGLMFTRATPMMQSAEFLGIGMIVIGLAMIINGVTMATRKSIDNSQM